MTKSERFKEEYDNTLHTLAKTKVKINLIEVNVKKEDLPKCPEYSRLQQKYEELIIEYDKNQKLFSDSHPLYQVRLRP